MMEKFRDFAKGPVAIVLLGLVIVSFAVTGVDSYLKSGGSDFVVKINDDKITQNDWDRAFEQERNRLGEAYSQLADSEDKVRELRKGVLDRLILERLSRQSAEQGGLRIGKDALNKAVWDMEVFQVAGKFNAEQYQSLLQNNGLTSEMFQESMKSDLIGRQLARGVSESAFTLSDEAKAVYQLESQQREIEVLRIATANYAKAITVTDAEAKAYFDANPQKFREPEQVKLEYLQLSAEKMAGDKPATDDELKAFYKEKIANYKAEETRHLAHILINADSDAKADDVKKAEAKIAELEKRIKAGEDFAAIAKKESEDTGSGENGGDLDWVAKGDMEAEFEQAAFALKNKGDVSAVVRTAYGFHLIKLLDIKAGGELEFEKVRARVVADLRKSKLDALATEFYAKRQTLEDKSYEFSDSLSEAQKASGLALQQTGFITRDSKDGIAANPKVQKAAFSDEVLQEHRNSEVIELGEQDVVVLRVKEHKPASPKAFETVKAEIVAELTSDKARAQAKALADALHADLKAGKDIAEKLKTEKLAWEKLTIARNGGAIDMDVVKAAFQMGSQGDSSRKLLQLPNGDQILVHLLAVKPADMSRFDGVGKSQLIDGLARYHGDLDYRAYIAALRAEGKIVYSAAAEKTTEPQ